jgi:hypothetical protein
MKNTFQITIIAILIIAVGIYYFIHSHNQSTIEVVPSTWKIYTNTIYGYQVSYPQDAVVDSIIGTVDSPVEESDDITITTKEHWTAVGVTAYIPLTGWGVAIEKKQINLITLPLPQFAKAVRQMQVDDQNPYELGKQSGELQEITFNGQRAYSLKIMDFMDHMEIMPFWNQKMPRIISFS